MKSYLPDVFIEELKSDANDIGTEVLEVALDGFMDNELVEKIPIIKTVKLVYDVGTAFRDQRFAKNVLIFLSSYQKNELNDEDINKFFSDAKNNEKIAEITFLRLEEMLDERMPTLLSLLLQEIIRQKLDLDRYIYLSDAIKQIRMSDYPIFKELSNKHIDRFEMNFENKMSLQRLNQLSLLDEDVVVANTVGNSKLRYSYGLNDDGKIIAKIILDNLL